MSVHGRTVVSLPTLTKVAHQTKIQPIGHAISPTKHYRILCSRCETPWWFWIGLPTLTTVLIWLCTYRTRPLPTFTTATGDRGIKPNQPFRVGQYRWYGLPGGQGLHSIERWHTVGHSGEPFTHSERVTRWWSVSERKSFSDCSWSHSIL